MIRVLVVVVALAAIGAACGSTDDKQTLTVMAASSLTDAFEELAEEFASNGEVDVELILAGSSGLATQVEEGAPAHVVATADLSTMERVEATGRVVGDVSVFAQNSLVVAVTPEAGAEITQLSDLEGGEVLVAICAEQVPCGILTTQLFDAADLSVAPATYEPNVRSVLAKVLLGEVDAGLVYGSDVNRLSEDKVIVLFPPDSEGLVTRYPIAALADDSQAAAFVEFVLSNEGQRIIGEHGFELVLP